MRWSLGYCIFLLFQREASRVSSTLVSVSTGVYTKYQARLHRLNVSYNKEINMLAATDHDKQQQHQQVVQQE